MTNKYTFKISDDKTAIYCNGQIITINEVIESLDLLNNTEIKNIAIVNQIKRWTTALSQMNKAMIRKNNRIKRLEDENRKLRDEFDEYFYLRNNKRLISSSLK